MKRYNLAPGDFPDIRDYQEKLQEMDFSKFHTLKQKMIDEVDNVLSNDIPRLMDALPRALDSVSQLANASLDNRGPLIYGNNVFGGGGDDANPWADEGDVGDLASGSGRGWALEEYISQYKPQFDSCQKNGLVSGAAAKNVLTSSGLPTAKLRKIWELSDLDKDGNLDLVEFVLAMYLADAVKQGSEIPATLDERMIPPGKPRP
jgi:EH domain-containing protein 1